MQNEEQKQTEQQNINKNWLEEEADALNSSASSSFDGEMLPALKLEEKKITEIEIDFNKSFDEWKSPEGAIKKIIPILHNGEKKVFWINVRNPVYKEIIQKGRNGQTKFKILRTGQQKNTRYNLVD